MTKMRMGGMSFAAKVKPEIEGDLKVQPPCPGFAQAWPLAKMRARVG